MLKHLITMKASLTKVRSIQTITQENFKHDKNIFLSALNVRTFLTRCTRLSDGLVRPTRFLKSSGLAQSLPVRRQQTLKLDINTNVQNNVILYKYENNFRAIRIFAIGQLFGWSMLALYTYSPSFFDIYYTDVKFEEYLKNNLLRLPLFIFSIIAGPAIYGTIYAVRIRTIKYIILNKGGKNVTLTTYHPRKKKSNINVPIEMVKSLRHRTDVGAYLPLKLQNKPFHYLVEKQGTFLNPELFDHTVGLA